MRTWRSPQLNLRPNVVDLHLKWPSRALRFRAERLAKRDHAKLVGGLQPSSTNYYRKCGAKLKLGMRQIGVPILNKPGHGSHKTTAVILRSCKDYPRPAILRTGRECPF